MKTAKLTITDILFAMILVAIWATVWHAKSIKETTQDRLEIYTPDNIYYVDQSALTVNAETWDHELRFETKNQLLAFIAEQTAADAAINE